MAYGYRRPCLLRLDALSERVVPSVTWKADDTTGVVTITGDQRGNTIDITDNGTGGFTVSADGWDAAEEFDGATYTKVVVRSWGGADAVDTNTSSAYAPLVVCRTAST